MAMQKNTEGVTETMIQAARYGAFGYLIAKHRMREGRTQADLAKAVGVSTSQFSRCEKGTRRLKESQVKLIAKELKLSTAEKNRLLAAAFYPAESKEGLDLTHPALVPVIAYFDNTELSAARKDEAAAEIAAVIEIESREAQSTKMRMARKWAEARKLCLTNLELVENLSATLRWQTLNDLALIEYHSGRLLEADQYFRQTLELSRKTSNLVWQIDDLTHRGDILRLQGYWPDAFELYEQANHCTEKLERASYGRKGKGLIERKEAETLLFQGYSQEAWPKLHQSLNIFRKLKDVYEKGKTYASIGWAYDFVGDWRKAIKYKTKGQELAGEAADDRYNIMKSYLYLGDSYFVGGKIVAAREHYRKALELGPEGNLEQGLIELGLANSFCALGKTGAALELYRASRESAQRIQSPYRRALAEYGMGSCLLHDPSKWKRAKLHLEKALELFSDHSTKYYQTLTLLSLVEYSRKNGEQAEANNLLQEATDLAHKITTKIAPNFVLAKVDLAQASVAIWFGKPDPDELSDVFVSAIVQAAEFNDHYLRATSSEIRYKLLAKLQQEDVRLWSDVEGMLEGKLRQSKAMLKHKDAMPGF